MSLVVIVALGLLSFAVGLVAPIADQELRQARGAFRALVVRSAARAGIAELEDATWLALGTGVPVGGLVALPPMSLMPDLVVDRELRRIGPELWLGVAVATASDRGGGALAASRQGVLLRVGRLLPDTTVRVRVASRSWVEGFQ